MIIFQLTVTPKMSQPEKKFAEVSIYPNPASTSTMALSIRATAIGKERANGGSVEIMTSSGQRLWKRELREIEITNSPDGTNEIRVTVPCGMGGLNLKGLAQGKYLASITLKYGKDEINTTREFRLIG